MTAQEKVKAIEKNVGRAVAARMAGVSTNSWYRWASGLVKPEESKDGRTLALINLLYDKFGSSPPRDGAPPAQAGASQ